MGYGGPSVLPQPQFELNVANRNGIQILAELGLTVSFNGECDAHDMLAALALSERTRYHGQLEKIASKAVQYSRKVIWG